MRNKDGNVNKKVNGYVNRRYISNYEKSNFWNILFLDKRRRYTA